MSRSLIAALLTLLIWPGTAGRATASGEPARLAAVAADLSRSGALDPFITPTHRPEPGAALPSARHRLSLHSSSNCQRWRNIAHKLGETFAAHSIRTALLARECVLSPEIQGSTDGETWEWPWSNRLKPSELPPVKHAAFGAWEIRCAKLSDRERCAMVQPAWIAGRQHVSSRLITTHLVIDNVAGRETVLWRTFVRRAGSDWFARPTSPDVGDPTGRRLYVATGGPLVSFKFSHCAPEGCMSEAPLQLAGQTAARLAEGRPVGLVVKPTASETIRGVILARGFREAFTELKRLRRLEQPSFAHRRPGIE